MTCDSNVPRPRMDTPVGYLMFGAEPASEQEDDYYNHMAMQIDDIKFADTFKSYTYPSALNWFSKLMWLSYVKPADLYRM